MKKTACAILASVATLTLAACGDEPADETTTIQTTAEEDEVAVDVPEIPAEDVTVATEPANAGEPATDDGMTSDPMAEEPTMDPGME